MTQSFSRFKEENLLFSHREGVSGHRLGHRLGHRIGHKGSIWTRLQAHGGPAFVRFDGPIFETEKLFETCAPQGASPVGAALGKNAASFNLIV